MNSIPADVVAYLSALPEERREPMRRLRDTIAGSLPEGFEERLSYRMPGWVVPHSTYPAGYHCDPKLPLPFVNIASQARHIGLYHMGLYANSELLEWFVAEYPKHVRTKLDMGKSCIRFKKPEAIPFELVGELMKRMTVDEWVALYERGLRK
jgi:uncharacterized protein YdhG (YjbR/CyaY superfamily)